VVAADVTCGPALGLAVGTRRDTNPAAFDSQPASACLLTRRTLPLEIGEKIVTHDLELEPIFALLEQRYGIPLLEAEYKLEAIPRIRMSRRPWEWRLEVRSSDRAHLLQRRRSTRRLREAPLSGRPYPVSGHAWHAAGRPASNGRSCATPGPVAWLLVVSIGTKRAGGALGNGERHFHRTGV